MRSRGCKPDAVAFASLLNALAGGAQWQRSLHVYGRLQVGCAAVGPKAPGSGLVSFASRFARGSVRPAPRRGAAAAAHGCGAGAHQTGSPRHVAIMICSVARRLRAASQVPVAAYTC